MLQSLGLIALASLVATPTEGPAESSAGSLSASPGWTQWGGPGRNFKVEAPPLAVTWPEEGPPRIWERDLGAGYSSIVSDEGLLYTLYRKSPDEEREFVIALDAATGETVWEHGTEAPLRDDPNPSDWGGTGPNSTPLIVGSRLFTIGSRALVQCFDKKTGEILWAHDAVEEFGTPVSESTGFCPSPIAYRDTIIVPLGCGRQGGRVSGAPCDALFSFDQETGEVVWASMDFETHFSSPILIQHHDRDHLVLSTPGGLFGVDPTDGSSRWTYPVAGSIVTPVWDGVEFLFFSSGGDTTKGFVLFLSDDGGMTPEEVWGGDRRVDFWQPTPVELDGFLYGSTSEELLCLEMISGEIAWREEGFPVATVVAADGKLVLLDENGRLSLVTATPGKLEIHARSRVLERYAFTAPTLVGSTLFLRDRKRIMALELGVPSR
jgi:outer membrane protein assembly factor BamB